MKYKFYFPVGVPIKGWRHEYYRDVGGRRPQLHLTELEF